MIDWLMVRDGIGTGCAPLRCCNTSSIVLAAEAVCSLGRASGMFANEAMLYSFWYLMRASLLGCASGLFPKLRMGTMPLHRADTVGTWSRNFTVCVRLALR